MDLLRRSLAPILPEAWRLIDDEARRILELHLAGRKIVDFFGPHGWKHAAVGTGRVDRLGDRADADVEIAVRRVQPLVEVRVPIRLSMTELDSVARGGDDPDLSAVVRAAAKIAVVEDTAIFMGLDGARIQGILPASPHAPRRVPEDIRSLPATILDAKETLRTSGIAGPYALVLGARLHDRVLAASEEGHSLAKRIEQQIVDRPMIRAEAIDGGVVLSLRGGTYELTVGQDLSIGYAHHSRDDVELFLTESFTFRVLEAGAAVRLSTSR